MTAFSTVFDMDEVTSAIAAEAAQFDARANNWATNKDEFSVGSHLLVMRTSWTLDIYQGDILAGSELRSIGYMVGFYGAHRWEDATTMRLAGETASTLSGTWRALSNAVDYTSHSGGRSVYRGFLARRIA